MLIKRAAVLPSKHCHRNYPRKGLVWTCLSVSITVDPLVYSKLKFLISRVTWGIYNVDNNRSQNNEQQKQEMMQNNIISSCCFKNIILKASDMEFLIKSPCDLGPRIKGPTTLLPPPASHPPPTLGSVGRCDTMWRVLELAGGFRSTH